MKPDRRHLHEYTADTILDRLAMRMDEYVEAKHEADAAEARLKSMYATQYLAIRKAEKCSVEDAKQRVLADPTYIETWVESLALDMTRAKAMNKLELARTATDLWRSEQANRRQV